MTDIIQALDNNARQSLTVPGETRELIRAAVAFILAVDGDVDFGRVREFLPEWASGAECGSTICAMVRADELRAIPGRFATLGNTKHRAGSRPVKVYARGPKWTA